MRHPHANRLRTQYNLADVQPDHPLRVAADELDRLHERVAQLDAEAAAMLTLARENGQLRDAERRRANAADALLREALDDMRAEWCSTINDQVTYCGACGRPCGDYGRHAPDCILARIDAHLGETR